METRLYRALLRLLPRHRRVRYGDEMAAAFADVVGEAKQDAGWLGVADVWTREAAGMLRFSLRELVARVTRRLEGGSLRLSGGRWNLPAEVRWAWRGVRARRWRAALSVALIALALSANALVFSATDALVFNDQPYREPDRLVTLRMSSYPTLRDLRSFTDLFSAVHGYLQGATIVTGDRDPVRLDTSFVTPGLLEMLSGGPRYGRGFAEADTTAADPPPAVIAEDLARERFGRAQAAVGQMLETSDRSLLVIGVMPAGFRFPDGRTRIWRVLDYGRYAGGGVVIQGFPGMWPIARLAPGVAMPHVEAEVVQRVPSHAPPAGRLAVEPIRFGRAPEPRRAALLAMFGAAVCLLLIACANVASIELASLPRRERQYSIQVALGASRATIAREALVEGAMLVGLALFLAAALTIAGLGPLTSRLPESVTARAVNPIDLDWRIGAFMLAAALTTWLLVFLPAVLVSVRTTLVNVLKQQDRSATGSVPATLVRGTLTIGQVAFAVVLLVGGLLYSGTYVHLLAIETGADLRGVVNLSVKVPPATGPTDELEARVRARLSSHRDVISFARLYGSAPPNVGYAQRANPQIDGRPPTEQSFTALVFTVEPSFFTTLRVPLLAGRVFNAADPPTVAVISETMARRFWPSQSPLGRTFRLDASFPQFVISGVVGHVRNDRDSLAGPGENTFAYYVPVPPGTSAPAGALHRPGDTETSAPVNVPFHQTDPMTTIGFLVRLGDAGQLASVLGAVRSVDPRIRTEVQFLDDAYASRHAETLMATSIVAGFAVFAFAVALAGIYGVMAFLVAARTREIGIRMALGADRRAISRMVLGSSTRLVLAGAALGSGAALLASRWIESQLYGVSPTDPVTYVTVSAAVIATALLATWHPARQAACVDPAITLRTE